MLLRLVAVPAALVILLHVSVVFIIILPIAVFLYAIVRNNT